MQARFPGLFVTTPLTFNPRKTRHETPATFYQPCRLRVDPRQATD
jgi:hypothetical protein